MKQCYIETTKSQKKIRPNLYENCLFKLKQIKKNIHTGDFGSKNQKSSLFDEKR
jgi:hypothetical protein